MKLAKVDFGVGHSSDQCAIVLSSPVISVRHKNIPGVVVDYSVSCRMESGAVACGDRNLFHQDRLVKAG